MQIDMMKRAVYRHTDKTFVSCVYVRVQSETDKKKKYNKISISSCSIKERETPLIEQTLTKGFKRNTQTT